MSQVEQEVLRAMLGPLFDRHEPLLLPARTDDELLKLARRHRLSPALSVLPAWNGSVALLESFRQDRLVTMGRAALLRRDLAEAVSSLGGAGVRTVVLKGLAYSEMIYPDAGTRPGSDIDVMVEKTKRPVAFDVFRALGYRLIAGAPGFDDPDYHEVTMRRGDTFVDLHFGLAPFVRGSIGYDDLWAAITSLPIEGAHAYTLSRPHAALNQALHMAIHHYDVPGIYLLDLARLVAQPGVFVEAQRTARLWRVLRAWETSTALTAHFIPAFRRWLGFVPLPNRSRATRVIHSFGAPGPLPRRTQLRRKLEHFDTRVDALRYLTSQGARVLRERIRRAAGVGSSTNRLGWP